MEEVIKLSSINKSYGDFCVYKDFNIDINVGKINCLLGKSGCGKTTLLNIIAEKEAFKNNISYVFQEHRLIPWKNIYSNLKFALSRKLNNIESEDIINKYLYMFDLNEYKNKYPAELSGGLKQKVNIARALAYPSKLVLMDEPFKSLDVQTKTKIISQVKEISRSENRTIIMVTHDIEEALNIADTIYVFGNSPVNIIYQCNLFDNSKNINRIKDDLMETFKNKQL